MKNEDITERKKGVPKIGGITTPLHPDVGILPLPGPNVLSAEKLLFWIRQKMVIDFLFEISVDPGFAPP